MHLTLWHFPSIPFSHLPFFCLCSFRHHFAYHFMFLQQCVYVCWPSSLTGQIPAITYKGFAFLILSTNDPNCGSFLGNEHVQLCIGKVNILKSLLNTFSLVFMPYFWNNKELFVSLLTLGWVWKNTLKRIWSASGSSKVTTYKWTNLLFYGKLKRCFKLCLD